MKKKILVSLLTGLLLLTAIGTVHSANITQTQVSQLYISIFGRASEGEGNLYWRENYDDMVLVAEAMLNTDAAKTYFGDTLNNNQKFIEFIYENTLGKTYSEDPDGVNYWVAQLAHGNSKGVVVVALIYGAMDSQYLGSASQNRFKNRVAVSNHTADTITSAPDVNDLSLFVGFISDVTDESTTVTSAKNDVDTFVGKGKVPPTPSVPSAPTGVSASDGTYTDKVKITWNSSSGATSYEVWRGTSSSSSSATKLGTVNGTAAYVTGLTAGKKYFFWVKAVNSSGTSEFSSYNTGYMKASTPTTPSVVGTWQGEFYKDLTDWSKPSSKPQSAREKITLEFYSNMEWSASVNIVRNYNYQVSYPSYSASGTYKIIENKVEDLDGKFELNADTTGKKLSLGFWKGKYLTYTSGSFTR